MSNLENALIESGYAQTEEQANNLVCIMYEKATMGGEDPEYLLYKFGLEPDYIDDILEYKPLVSEKPTKNQESLLFKIKALLNKAESSDSQEEKDAFMMKAQDLIHKNGLTHEKVLAERWDSKSGFKEEDIIEERVSYEEEWDRKLMQSISEGNMCKVIMNSGKKLIYIIGFESKCESVVILCDFYKKAILNLAVESARKKSRTQKVLAKSLTNNKKVIAIAKIEKKEQEDINDYLFGAIDGLADALFKKEELFKCESFEKEDGTLVTGREIAVINRDRIEDYISRKYPNLGYFSGGGGGNTESSSYGKGFKDGGGLGAVRKRLN